MGHPEKVSLEVKRRGGKLKMLGVGAACLVAGGVFMKACGDDVVEVERTAEVKEMTVTKIEPIDLDCRARTTAQFKDQAKLNMKALGLDLANDYKANTTGEVTTLTCVRGAGVGISVERIEDLQTGVKTDRQTITVPAENVVFFSRINEDKTVTTMDYDATAGVGRSVWGMLDAVGIDGGVEDKLKKEDGKLRQASREFAVNAVQQECGKAAWEVTKQVVEDGYKLKAKEQGIDPSTIHVVFEPADRLPDFTGPYQPDGRYKYKIDDFGDDGQTCVVNESARVPVVLEQNTMRVPQ